MKLVSVIIPTYNRIEKLKRALESVLKQTYSKLEIIIVDNESKDGTIKFLEEFSKKNKKIKYLTNNKKGANYSRNLGIKNAKGEYIAFLDDDDTWNSTKIEKQVKILETNSDIGICYTGKKIIYESLNKEYFSCSNSNNIYIENYIGTTSSVIIKKEILEKSGLFDVELPALQDYDLWIRILKNTKSYQIKEALINYYINPNNNQISNSIESYEKGIQYLDKKYNTDVEYIKFEIEREKKREKELIIRSIREKQKIDIKKIKYFHNKLYYTILRKLNFNIILIMKKWRNMYVK